MIRHGVHYERSLIGAARELRDRRTTATAILWHEFRGRKLSGLTFRREHQIADFVVDSYCLELKLAIECDGSVHEATKEYDAARDETLKAMGVTVLRFRNGDVELNASWVLREIARVGESLRTPGVSTCDAPHP